MVKESISSGKALDKLKQIVKNQGGSTLYIDKPNLLLKANKSFDVLANKAGYISAINTACIGLVGHDLQKINGQIVRQDDAGIILSARLGDFVKSGDKLATI